MEVVGNCVRAILSAYNQSDRNFLPLPQGASCYATSGNWLLYNPNATQNVNTNGMTTSAE
jgi:hypothetical protein